MITGVPHARDSILTVGKFSSLVGLTKTSAQEYNFTSSCWLYVLCIEMIFSSNCLSIILVLQGHKVDKVSSNSKLAQRDEEEFERLYNYFGISVGHIVEN